MIACPNVETLRKLMNDELAETELLDLEKHIESCGQCQQRLEELDQSFTADHSNQLPGDLETNAEALPEQAGRYQIVEEIARGAMGVVLRARDPDMERTLAVKLMLSNAAGKPDAQKRFLEEAKLTGQLQHPGIPPVHEMGRLEDGRPFFAMKLIKGQTMAALLQQRSDRRLACQPETAGEPPAATDQSRFLGIFSQICQTIAYAHSRGVIHRDLKPLNVMVGAFGEVQVMDWGLAKLIAKLPEEPETTAVDESTIHTVRISEGVALSQTGDIMGTPAYMPPEQASGLIRQLDTRCDVFGLGAILCTILTGAPPYRGKNTREVLLQALTGNLSEAFARLVACGADVELIDLCKRCLAAERDQRPQHAGAVAELVEGYQARVQERLRQAELAKAQAEVQAVEERKRREVERKKRRTQMGLAAAILLLIIAGAVGGLWYQQMKADREARHARFEQSARDAVEQARELRKNLHMTLAKSGGVFKLLNTPLDWKGQLDSARSAVEHAKKLQKNTEKKFNTDLESLITELMEKLKKDEEDRLLALDLERVREESLTFLDDKFDYAGALKSYMNAFGKAGLYSDKETPMDLGARMRRSPIREQLLAVLHHWVYVSWQENETQLLATLLETARHADRSQWPLKLRSPDLWREYGSKAAVQIAEELLQDPERLSALPPQHLSLVGQLLSTGSPLEERWLRQANLLYPDDFWLCFSLGHSLSERTQHLEAQGFFHAALAIRPKSAVAWNNLGRALVNDRPAAISAFKKAIANRPRFALAWYNLGHALSQTKGPSAAIDAYKKALEIKPRFAWAWYNLGFVLQKCEDLPGAIASYEKAVAIDPQFVKAWNNLGLAHRANKNLPRAIEAYEKAVAIAPQFAKAWNNLGLALRADKKLPAAIAAFKTAINIDPQYALAHANLGVTFRRQGEFAEAVASLQRALKFLPAEHPSRPSMMRDLMRCRQLLKNKSGDYEIIIREFARSRGIEPAVR